MTRLRAIPVGSRWRRAAVAGVAGAVTAVGAGCLPPVHAPQQPGLTDQVGPTTRACRGVPVRVGDDLQEKIGRHPPGTTFCLAPGVHRLRRPVAPKSGDAIIGRRGAVLSGSQVLDHWREVGAGRWSTTGRLPARPGTHGTCRPAEPDCALAEDVFFDKHRLRRVRSRSAVTAGTVFADYRTDTVTIGRAPRGHLVEQAVAPALVRGTADDVTVANLVLEQSANPAQAAAVESRHVRPESSGSRWRVLGNEVRLNHGVGIGVADESTVRRNLVDRQGQLGIGVWGHDAVIRDNEIAFNGTAGYSADWEAGGAKIWETDSATLAHNLVHDNRGPGLWTDGGNIATSYRYNEIDDNWGAGIQHEISYDATITHNDIVGNGRRDKGWAWDAGIQIQSSGGVGVIDVAYNRVADNANGITLIDSGGRAGEEPAPHGPHVVRNVWVHDNTVTMFPGQTTGAVEDTDDPGIFTRNDNRFDDNTYCLPSVTGRYFSWAGEDLSWNRWRRIGDGHDLAGAAFRCTEPPTGAQGRPTTKLSVQISCLRTTSPVWLAAHIWSPPA